MSPIEVMPGSTIETINEDDNEQELGLRLGLGRVVGIGKLAERADAADAKKLSVMMRVGWEHLAMPGVEPSAITAESRWIIGRTTWLSNRRKTC